VAEERHQDDEFDDYMRNFASRQFDPTGIDLDRFWLGERNRFPILGGIARDLYTIPATSCDVERGLSQATLIVTPRRMSLTAEHQQALEVAGANLEGFRENYRAGRPLMWENPDAKIPANGVEYG
jgi:hypothetical protein